MTANQKPSRADQVRQRRKSTPRPQEPAVRPPTSTARKTYRPDSVYMPVEPRPVSRQNYGKFTSTAQTSSLLDRVLPVAGGLRQAPARPTGRNTKRQARNNYDYSFSLGRTDIRAPALSIPQLGTRWISLLISAFLVFLLSSMWNASTFRVTTAEVHGNQRLSAADINSMLGLVGQPIFKAIPVQIQADLRTAFPDLSSVRVGVGFPNHLKVTVVERTPVLAWYQGEAVTWIDANGVAFLPRGQVKGLIQVSSNGTPPKVLPDTTKSLFDQVFIDPGLVKAMTILAPYVPSGSPMAYDPRYGMGWQDPRGWSVYFGQNTKDIPMKLAIYQSIVDTFVKKGIQPSMVSVEYLDAPFYK
jgi:cell division protein FtsQ